MWEISDFFRKFWNKRSTSWPIWLNKIPRSYINGVKLPAKFQLCKSFQLLTIARQSFSFGAPFRSHQEFSWPQKNSEGLLWPPPPVCQILSQKINIKCLKSAGKKPPKRHNLDTADLVTQISNVQISNFQISNTQNCNKFYQPFSLANFNISKFGWNFCTKFC